MEFEVLIIIWFLSRRVFKLWKNRGLQNSYLTALDHPKAGLQCQIQMIDPMDIKKSYWFIYS